MDFGLSEVHTQIRNTIRTFVKRECPRESAHALDAAGTPPIELLAKVAEMGICGFNVPESFGGAGPDMLAAALVTETLASASPTLAALYAGVTFCGGASLSRLASPEQQARLLPDVAAGELVVSIIHSDGQRGPAAAIKPAGDGFTLDGHAPFVQPFRSDGLIVVRAGDQDDTSWFLLPAGAPGLRIAPLAAVGMRGAGAVSMSFEGVAAGPEDVLGGPQATGQGGDQAKTLLAAARMASAATAIGLAQGALDYAAAYARERSQFGRPIAQFEAVLHMLVDLAVDVDAARWQLYHACWLADQGRPFELEAATADLKATEVARQAGLQGVHILGGYGYMAEYDAGRYLRDALVGFNGGESSALLKTAIGDLAALREPPV
jgi:alkylation response protein AidB-like acyl-CoA dehydrogenase